MPGRDCLKLLNQSPTRIHIRRKKHSDRNCRIRIDHSQLSLSCLYSFKVAVNLKPEALATAIGRMAEAGAQVVIVQPNGMFINQRSAILKQVLAAKLPSIFADRGAPA